MTYKSESLKTLYRLVMRHGGTPTRMREFRAAFIGLKGDMYFHIFNQEKNRTSQLKQAWRVAEDVYYMFYGEDRFNSYSAMKMALSKYEQNHDDRDSRC